MEDLPLEIGAKSQAWILERRPSVGPCFRPGLPFEGPTGITIHMPRKSMVKMRSSGIHINVSRKNSTSKSKSNVKRGSGEDTQRATDTLNVGENKLFSTLKEKMSSVHDKLKNVFNV